MAAPTRVKWQHFALMLVFLTLSSFPSPASAQTFTYFNVTRSTTIADALATITFRATLSQVVTGSSPTITLTLPSQFSSDPTKIQSTGVTKSGNIGAVTVQTVNPTSIVLSVGALPTAGMALWFGIAIQVYNPPATVTSIPLDYAMSLNLGTGTIIQAGPGFIIPPPPPRLANPTLSLTSLTPSTWCNFRIQATTTVALQSNPFYFTIDFPLMVGTTELMSPAIGSLTVGGAAVTGTIIPTESNRLYIQIPSAAPSGSVIDLTLNTIRNPMDARNYTDFFLSTHTPLLDLTQAATPFPLDYEMRLNARLNSVFLSASIAEAGTLTTLRFAVSFRNGIPKDFDLVITTTGPYIFSDAASTTVTVIAQPAITVVSYTKTSDLACSIRFTPAIAANTVLTFEVSNVKLPTSGAVNLDNNEWTVYAQSNGVIWGTPVTGSGRFARTYWLNTATNVAVTASYPIDSAPSQSLSIAFTYARDLATPMGGASAFVIRVHLPASMTLASSAGEIVLADPAKTIPVTFTLDSTSPVGRFVCSFARIGNVPVTGSLITIKFAGIKYATSTDTLTDVRVYISDSSLLQFPLVRYTGFTLPTPVAKDQPFAAQSVTVASTNVAVIAPDTPDAIYEFSVTVPINLVAGAQVIITVPTSSLGNSLLPSPTSLSMVTGVSTVRAIPVVSWIVSPTTSLTVTATINVALTSGAVRFRIPGVKVPQFDVPSIANGVVRINSYAAAGSAGGLYLTNTMMLPPPTAGAWTLLEVTSSTMQPTVAQATYTFRCVMPSNQIIAAGSWFVMTLPAANPVDAVPTVSITIPAFGTVAAENVLVESSGTSITIKNLPAVSRGGTLLIAITGFTTPAIGGGGGSATVGITANGVQAVTGAAVLPKITNPEFTSYNIAWNTTAGGSAAQIAVALSMPPGTAYDPSLHSFRLTVPATFATASLSVDPASVSGGGNTLDRVVLVSANVMDIFFTKAIPVSSAIAFTITGLKLPYPSARGTCSLTLYRASTSAVIVPGSFLTPVLDTVALSSPSVTYPTGAVVTPGSTRSITLTSTLPAGHTHTSGPAGSTIFDVALPAVIFVSSPVVTVNNVAVINTAVGPESDGIIHITFAIGTTPATLSGVFTINIANIRSPAIGLKYNITWTIKYQDSTLFELLTLFNAANIPLPLTPPTSLGAAVPTFSTTLARYANYALTITASMVPIIPITGTEVIIVTFPSGFKTSTNANVATGTTSENRQVKITLSGPGATTNTQTLTGVVKGQNIYVALATSPVPFILPNGGTLVWVVENGLNMPDADAVRTGASLSIAPQGPDGPGSPLTHGIVVGQTTPFSFSVTSSSIVANPVVYSSTVPWARDGVVIYSFVAPGTEYDYVVNTASKIIISGVPPLFSAWNQVTTALADGSDTPAAATSATYASSVATIVPSKAYPQGSVVSVRIAGLWIPADADGAFSPASIALGTGSLGVYSFTSNSVAYPRVYSTVLNDVVLSTLSYTVGSTNVPVTFTFTMPSTLVWSHTYDAVTITLPSGWAFSSTASVSTTVSFVASGASTAVEVPVNAAVDSGLLDRTVSLIPTAAAPLVPAGSKVTITVSYLKSIPDIDISRFPVTLALHDVSSVTRARLSASTSTSPDLTLPSPPPVPLLQPTVTLANTITATTTTAKIIFKFPNTRVFNFAGDTFSLVFPPAFIFDPPFEAYVSTSPTAILSTDADAMYAETKVTTTFVQGTATTVPALILPVPPAYFGNLNDQYVRLRIPNVILPEPLNTYTLAVRMRHADLVAAFIATPVAIPQLQYGSFDGVPTCTFSSRTSLSTTTITLDLVLRAGLPTINQSHRITIAVPRQLQPVANPVTFQLFANNQLVNVGSIEYEPPQGLLGTQISASLLQVLPAQAALRIVLSSFTVPAPTVSLTGVGIDAGIYTTQDNVLVVRTASPIVTPSILGYAIADAALAPTSRIASAAARYTLSLTTAAALPNYAHIHVTLPDGFTCPSVETVAVLPTLASTTAPVAGPVFVTATTKTPACRLDLLFVQGQSAGGKFSVEFGPITNPAVPLLYAADKFSVEAITADSKAFLASSSLVSGIEIIVA